MNDSNLVTLREYRPVESVTAEKITTLYHTGELDYPISIEFEAKGKRYKGWIREENDG